MRRQTETSNQHIIHPNRVGLIHSNATTLTSSAPRAMTSKPMKTKKMWLAPVMIVRGPLGMRVSGKKGVQLRVSALVKAATKVKTTRPTWKNWRTARGRRHG